MNEQEQLMQIISAISEKTGETPEKVVAMLQEIMQTEGQEGVKAFIDKMLNPEAEMFRKGGKMEAAVNKFQRGGVYNRRLTQWTRSDNPSSWIRRSDTLEEHGNPFLGWDDDDTIRQRNKKRLKTDLQYERDLGSMPFKEAFKLAKSVNAPQFMWDGDWYNARTMDDNEKLNKAANDEYNRFYGYSKWFEKGGKINKCQDGGKSVDVIDKENRSKYAALRYQYGDGDKYTYYNISPGAYAIEKYHPDGGSFGGWNSQIVYHFPSLSNPFYTKFKNGEGEVENSGDYAEFVAGDLSKGIKQIAFMEKYGNEMLMPENKSKLKIIKIKE